MSDFVNEFWNWYVILIVLVSVVACGVFIQDVCATFSQQNFHDVGAIKHGGKHQWCAAILTAHIDLGAVIEQQLGNLHIAFKRRT